MCEDHQVDVQRTIEQESEYDISDMNVTEFTNLAMGCNDAATHLATQSTLSLPGDDHHTTHQQLISTLRNHALTIRELADEVCQWQDSKVSDCGSDERRASKSSAGSSSSRSSARQLVASIASTKKDLLDVLCTTNLQPGGAVRLVLGGRAGYCSVQAAIRLELLSRTRTGGRRTTVVEIQLWVPLGELGLPETTIGRLEVARLQELNTMDKIDDYAESLRASLAPGCFAMDVPLEELCDPVTLQQRVGLHMQNRVSVYYRDLRGTAFGRRLADASLQQQVELEFGALAMLLETWHTHVLSLGAWAFTTGGSTQIRFGEYVRMDESTFKNIYVNGSAQGDQASCGLLIRLAQLHRCQYDDLVDAVVDVTEILLLGMRVAYHEVLFTDKTARQRAVAAMDVVNSVNAAACAQRQHRPPKSTSACVYLDPCGLVATRLSAAIAVWIQSSGSCGRITWPSTLQMLEGAITTKNSEVLAPYVVSEEDAKVRRISNAVDVQWKIELLQQLRNSAEESKRRRQEMREALARRRNNVQREAGATRSADTFYHVTSSQAIAHLLQAYHGLDQDLPTTVISMVLHSVKRGEDGRLQWATLSEAEIEDLMQVVDSKELEVLAAEEHVVGLTQYDDARRRELFNASTVVRSSEAACFDRLSASDAHLVRNELPAAMATIRQMHCMAMYGQSAESFSDKTSRDPATNAVLHATSNAGYRSTWQEVDRERGGHPALFSIGHRTSQRRPVASIFAIYPSALQLLAATGRHGSLTTCGHVLPCFMAKSAEPYGALVSMVRSDAWRVVARALEIVADMHHPGLIDIGRRVLQDTDYYGRAQDSFTLIEYGPGQGVAKQWHYDATNQDDCSQTSLAQLHGQNGPYCYARTVVQHDGRTCDINAWRSERLEGPLHSPLLPAQPGSTDSAIHPVSIASIDFLRTSHQVFALRRTKQSPVWDCATGQPPAEGCTVVVAQRKAKVTGAQYVRKATIVISQWLQRKYPATATKLGVDFMELFERVEATVKLPAEYKAARRDGMLPKTKPYSERDWTARDYREANRRVAQDLDVDADDEEMGEVDVYTTQVSISQDSVFSQDVFDTLQPHPQSHCYVTEHETTILDRILKVCSCSPAVTWSCMLPLHLYDS